MLQREAPSNVKELLHWRNSEKGEARTRQFHSTGRLDPDLLLSGSPGLNYSKHSPCLRHDP